MIKAYIKDEWVNYIGEMKNGKPNGRGRAYDNQENLRFEGVFKNGSLNGICC